MYIPTDSCQILLFFVDIFLVTGGFPGHWNWFPVTLEGPISWHSHSAPGTDDDYTIKFFPQDNAGFTTSTAGQGFIELEFDSDETIDHFSTPWWQSFHDAVDNSDSAAATLQDISNGLFPTPSEEIFQELEQAVEQVHQVLKDRSFAIVTGLFGLDCAHSVTDFNTELHPVYAMAIMVDDNPADQLWAIFVRNWGDEGFCSTKPHPLDLQTYSFRLPWKEGENNGPHHQFTFSHKQHSHRPRNTIRDKRRSTGDIHFATTRSRGLGPW